MTELPRETPQLVCTRNKAGFLRGGKSLVTRGARRHQITSDVYVTWKHSVLPDETDDTPVYEINANIWHRRAPKRIGYYQAYMLFPTDQFLDSRALFELCDYHNQTLCEFGEQLHGADSRLQQLLDGGELLFVHLIELIPAWHGHEIGSAVFQFMLDEARRAFGASVCIFEPVPLQFESPFPREAADADTLQAYEVARDSLRRYYIRTFSARPLRRGSAYYYVRIRSDRI